MKKTFMIIASLAVLTACGGGGEKEKESASTEQKAEGGGSDALSDNPDYQKGLALTSQSDCFTCHKIDEKNQGPAWRDVANKYAGQDTAVRYLADKIINGGSGVWGTIPMAAHPTMSREDAEAIAKYVLLLKNK